MYNILRITLKIDVEKYSILRITLKIQFEMYNSLRITLKIQFEMGRQFADHPSTYNLKCVYSLRIALKSEYGKYSKKTAAGTEYVGAPPCLQAITCIALVLPPTYHV